MKSIFSSAFICACVSLFAQVVLAEQIVLKNGDRISGKIVSTDKEKIVVRTEFAGVITIAVSNIARIIDDKTAQAESDAGEQVVAGDSDSKEAADPNITAESGSASEAVSKTRTSASGLMQGWAGSANLGFSLTSGNSRTTNFAAGLAAAKVSGKNKFTTYLNALNARNKNGAATVTTSNAIWGGLRVDRDITRRVFAFVSYDFERDIPQRLNFRSVFGGGLGFHAIKNDRTELDLFSGVAWNKTWYTLSTNPSSAEFLVGDSFRHRLNERTVFNQRLVIYPSLSNGGDYRAVWDSTLTSDITKRIGFFVTLGDRYNSAPLRNVKKNDLLFATGLKVGFGGTK